MQATIAERDVATARIHLDTATKQKNTARQTAALKAEREAQDRAEHSRAESERARSDLQASNDQVRRLERRAGR
ncbi:MAG TPA: hypothetical protein VIV11_39950 [Kofleriaceae bacterium]